MDGDDGAIILGGMDKHGSTNIFPIHVKKKNSRYSTGGASTVPTGYLVWALIGRSRKLRRPVQCCDATRE
jgi:hypothetical protein